jgi:hypothetical protein
MAVAHVDDVEASLRGEVLLRAQQLFGYAADAFGAAGPLAKALVTLDIKPLRTEQVEQYKKGKERAVTRNPWPWFLVAVWLAPQILCDGIVTWNHWWDATGPAGPMAAVIISLIVHAVLDIGFKEKFQKRRITWRWVTWSLGAWAITPQEYGYYVQSRLQPYPRYVPVHVLNLAVQLATELPEARFGVDELQRSVEDVPRPDPDPFLWVRLGGERYYLASWDEREFEAKA